MGSTGRKEGARLIWEKVGHFSSRVRRSPKRTTQYWLSVVPALKTLHNTEAMFCLFHHGGSCLGGKSKENTSLPASPTLCPRRETHSFSYFARPARTGSICPFIIPPPSSPSPHPHLRPAVSIGIGIRSRVRQSTPTSTAVQCRGNLF